MKIAIFTDTYLPTVNGVSYAIKSWQDELESRGHDVDVVCPSPGGDSGEITFRSFEIPFYDGYYAGYLPPKKDFSDYDVFYINSFFTVGSYGYRKAVKNDVKIVSIVHTPIEEYLDYLTSFKPVKRLIKSIYHKWEGRILSNSTAGVALSKYMENHIREISDNCKVKRLSNGVNTEFFEPKNKEEFKKNFEIESQKVIGFTGRLSSEKRVDELIELANRFDGEVIIGGDGPCREKYEEMVKSENVRFLGFLNREDLPGFYSSLDAFIFPSRAENDPLTVLEANACGTPVVGADAAGMTDSIMNGENGYLYEPGDIDSLEKNLKKVYQNQDSFSKSTVSFADKKSISSTVDDLIELVE